MADALALGVTYSSVKGGGRVPSPLGARARPLTTGRALLSYPYAARPFALPQSDKPCSYQDDQGRGILRGVLALIMLLAALFLPHF
jgi:hypothetical protein